MKEIKFRGKRIDNGEWVYGYLIKDNDNYYYIVNDYGGFRSVTEVNPKTIGQYTGLKDKNDKKICEEDIIELLCGNGVVKFGECDFQSYGDNDQHFCECVYIEYINGIKEVLTQNTMKEVIGNIYDNPELLKREE